MNKKIIYGILQGIVGACIGGLFAYFTLYNQPKEYALLKLLVGFVLLIVFSYVHVIIHEAGHLLAGLATGYKFVSFRVGSMMLVKQKGKMVVKKFNLPGTGGQCLLEAPPLREDGFPCLLYNLGGPLANFFASAVGLAFYYFLRPDNYYVLLGLIIFILLGLYIGFMNIIPMKAQGIANDGLNAKVLSRNPDAAKHFWIQLAVNKLGCDGVEIKDMKEEWFEIEDDKVLEDALATAIGVLKVSRFISRDEMEKAKSYCRFLLNNSRKIEGILINEIKCEMLFLEIVCGCNKGAIERLYDKNLKKYINKTKGYVQRQRLLYAYNKFVACNDVEAETAKAKFYKVAEKFPNLGEVSTEKKIMERLEGKPCDCNNW